MTPSVQRRVSAVVLAVLLALHVAAVGLSVNREPHVDETESLHAAWLMAQGRELYVDFFEHHSPFFFAALEPLAPASERVDAQPYFVRARWLCAVFGLIALASFGALFWRTAPEAAPIAIASILATGALWQRALTEVRADPFALAFFWTGALIAIRRRGALSGIGIGLIAVASLWHPKWPLPSLAVGCVWLVLLARRRSPAERAQAITGAILTTAAGFSVLRMMMPLDRWWFFMFDVNAALTRLAGASQFVLENTFHGATPLLFVPGAFHPWIVVPAAALVMAATFHEPHVERLLALTLLGAAWLEIRFIYPWPVIWTHYYVMWCLAAAVIYGLMPWAMAVLLRHYRAPDRVVAGSRVIVLSAATILVVPHVIAALPWSTGSSTYWMAQRNLQKQLQPGETVWLEPLRHPVTVHDADYYWFLVAQMTEVANELRMTARGRRYLPDPDDLPLCNPPANLRFTLDPRGVPLLADVDACMQELLDSGRIRKTMYGDVYELNLSPVVRLVRSLPEITP